MRETVHRAISNIVKTDTSISAIVEFKETDPIFAGHFPGRAIIPAVYQIAVCRNLAEQIISGNFSCLQRSRFSAVCVPQVRYDVQIIVTQPEGAGKTATCSIKSNGALQSKIVLIYE